MRLIARRSPPALSDTTRWRLKSMFQTTWKHASLASCGTRANTIGFLLPSYFYDRPRLRLLTIVAQLCEATCDGSAYFGTQYAVEVSDSFLWKYAILHDKRYQASTFLFHDILRCAFVGNIAIKIYIAHPHVNGGVGVGSHAGSGICRRHVFSNNLRVSSVTHPVVLLVVHRDTRRMV